MSPHVVRELAALLGCRIPTAPVLETGDDRWECPWRAEVRPDLK